MDGIIGEINKLIVRIGKGDIKALDKLHCEIGRMLLFMAKKYLYDSNCAEDVVSETYLKIVRSAKTFDRNKNGLNWIYKIIKNTAIDFNKECGKTIELKENTEREWAEDWLCGICVRETLDKLSDGEKELIYMRYWYGYSLKEIAERQNSPLSTVHGKLKSVLKKLEKTLKQTEKHRRGE